jgi:uncharacterized membrane protein
MNAQNNLYSRWLNYLNIVSSVSGVTGISLLWVKDKINITSQVIISFGLCWIIGLSIISLFLIWVWSIYQHAQLNWTTPLTLSFLVLAFLILTIVIFSYYNLCNKFLMPFLIELQVIKKTN